MNINSYLVLGKFKFETQQYTKNTRIRHKHAIFYPSVKFECFNKLLWYVKNIICVFCEPWMRTKTQKQNNTKQLGQQADKTHDVHAMDASDRRNVLCWTWVIAHCRIYAASDRTVACGLWQTFLRSPRSTEDICRINCVHRTDVVRLVALRNLS